MVSSGQGNERQVGQGDLSSQQFAQVDMVMTLYGLV